MNFRDKIIILINLETNQSKSLDEMLLRSGV